MGRSLKHYLNDQAARLLRNFPYPIRKKIARFPALQCGARDASVVVLCGPRQFFEGLWSLWSWMRHLNDKMGATLLFDGKASPQEQTLFNRMFPGGRLLEIDAYLQGRSLPVYFDLFKRHHWAGRKVAAIYELQKEQSMLYSDCDVLIFKQPQEIITAIAKGQSCYMVDDYALDPWMAGQAKRIGLTPSNQFNSGLFYVPGGEMKESVLKAMLTDWQPACNSHLAEQTLLSVLLNPENLRPLPSDRYVLSWQGVWVLERDLDCAEMTCRHYTGPTRHRMYLSGYPALLKTLRSGI